MWETISKADEECAVSATCCRDGRVVVSFDTDALEKTEEDRLMVCPVDDLTIIKVLRSGLLHVLLLCADEVALVTW